MDRRERLGQLIPEIAVTDIGSWDGFTATWLDSGGLRVLAADPAEAMVDRSR